MLHEVSAPIDHRYAVCRGSRLRSDTDDGTGRDVRRCPNHTTPRIDPPKGQNGEEAVWNHDELIRNNLFAWNRDAQVSGWFDVSDDREWPRETSTTRPYANGPSADGGLQSLHLQFVANLYAVRNGQGLFNWGVPWKRHIRCRTLNEVDRELGLEPSGRLITAAFCDPLKHDFRVARGGALLQSRSYPEGTVPLVILGRE